MTQNNLGSALRDQAIRTEGPEALRLLDEAETAFRQILLVFTREQLPQNWAKLGLSDDQKQSVYATQAKYKKELDELKKKLEELKDKERKELEDVLTREQKAKLKDIIAGKIPGDGKN